MLLPMDSTDRGQNSPSHVTVAVPSTGPPSNSFPPVLFVSPNSSGASNNSFKSLRVCSEYGSSKRGRDDSDSISAASSISSHVPIPAPVIPAGQQTFKRSRAVGYTAPRHVAKNTLLATMGSLAAAPCPQDPSGNTRVQFRRQLSGSKL